MFAKMFEKNGEKHKLFPHPIPSPRKVKRFRLKKGTRIQEPKNMNCPNPKKEGPRFAQRLSLRKTHNE